jgi:hypothetical protein
MAFLKIVRNVILLTLLFSCAINIGEIRKTPEYKGVDPEIQPYVDMYMELAKEHNVKFKHVVTVGFKQINDGAAVGLTNYGLGFREIDIDSLYWQYGTTRTGRIGLLFHEFSHAYCYRDHDYNKKEYGDSEEVRKHPPGPDMMYPDSCPKSIMYPIVLEDRCFVDHYLEYEDEMFANCKPY